jgi:hypothetical protein
VHGDVAAHQARQVARDLQPEAGAAVRAARSFVALHEALEERAWRRSSMPMPVSRR